MSVSQLADSSGATKVTIDADGSTLLSRVIVPVISTLTIASDAITITGSRHKVDIEGAAASNNLSTINGSIQDQFFWLNIVTNSRTVSIVHGTGNIRTLSGMNIMLSNDRRLICLSFTSTQSGYFWSVVAHVAY